MGDESGIITKYPFYVLNDGCSVHQDSWEVTWTDTYVKVVISGEDRMMTNIFYILMGKRILNNGK